MLRQIICQQSEYNSKLLISFSKSPYICTYTSRFKLKKRSKIQVKVLFLVLIYLFSANPTVLFHHHDAEIVSFEKASSCEKAIYYSNHGDKCSHTSHISKSPEKCLLCDLHAVSPHSFLDFLKQNIGKEQTSTPVKGAENYVYCFPSVFTNKGPPSLLSFSV